MCLESDETYNLLEVFNLFLLLCICFIALFSTIYKSYYTIQLAFSFFFFFPTVLSVKSFQFQLNKLFSNEPLAYCPCNSINKTHVLCYKYRISNIMKKKKIPNFSYNYLCTSPTCHSAISHHIIFLPWAAFDNGCYFTKLLFGWSFHLWPTCLPTMHDVVCSNF